MTDLTKDKMAAERQGLEFDAPVAAATTIYRGAMVALDASGDAIPAAPASPVMYGVAMAQADNADGAAGDITVRVKKGCFRFANSDLDRTDIGGSAFVSDDNTVASTGTLVAGTLVEIDAAGAWVQID